MRELIENIARHWDWDVPVVETDDGPCLNATYNLHELPDISMEFSIWGLEASHLLSFVLELPLDIPSDNWADLCVVANHMNLCNFNKGKILVHEEGISYVASVSLKHCKADMEFFTEMREQAGHAMRASVVRALLLAVTGEKSADIIKDFNEQDAEDDEEA